MKIKVRFLQWTLLAVLIAALAGCSSKPTDPVPPGPPPAANNILVSQLSAAMVPGGQATIVLSVTDGSTCAANCDDGSVATVSLAGSDLQIDAVAYGKTTVHLTSTSGLTREIPVEVYDPRMLETDELYIGFVDQFRVSWRTTVQIPVLRHYASFFTPKTNDGFRQLGDVGVAEGYPADYNPNGKLVAVVVKAKPGSNALAEAESFTVIWSHDNIFLSHGFFLNPVPPAGYVAMGSYAGMSILDLLPGRIPMCIREDLTYPGQAGTFIWNDDNSGAPKDLGAWEIKTRDVPPDEATYMPVGTFVAHNSWGRPSAHPVMNVLRVELPRFNAGPGQDFVPELTDYDTPPTETQPLRAYEMLVPWTMIKDSAFTSREKFAQSPLYRLERQVFYRRLFHNRNNTSVTQHNSVEIKSGVASTESETFKQSTGISITVSGGVNVGFFSASVSTTVSMEMGYESQTSITELHETTIHVDAVTLPGKATAIWQKWTRFIVKRHNGTSLQPVAAWEFGIDSYIIDEFPD